MSAAYCASGRRAGDCQKMAKPNVMQGGSHGEQRAEAVEPGGQETETEKERIAKTGDRQGADQPHLKSAPVAWGMQPSSGALAGVARRAAKVAGAVGSVRGCFTGC